MINEYGETQSCKNCKFFIQHYGLYNTSFRAVNCGHCMNTRFSLDKRRSFPFIDGCERWEQAEEQKSKDTLVSINGTLERIQKQLLDITAILTFLKSE